MKKLLILLPFLLFIVLDLLGGFFGWFGQWQSGENLLLTDWFGFGHGSTPEGIFVTFPRFLLDKMATGELSLSYTDYYYELIRITAFLLLAIIGYALYKYSIKTKRALKGE